MSAMLYRVEKSKNSLSTFASRDIIFGWLGMNRVRDADPFRNPARHLSRPSAFWVVTRPLSSRPGKPAEGRRVFAQELDGGQETVRRESDLQGQ